MAGARVTAGAVVSSGRWRWRQLDALVLSGHRLVHFRRRTDRPDRVWTAVSVVSETAVAPGQLMIEHGRLRARVSEPDGVAVRLFADGQWVPDSDETWREPRQPSGPTPAELGEDAVRVRGVAVADTGWPQALVDLDGTVYAYHQRPDHTWWRAQCVSLAVTPFAVAANSSTKLAQVTGERDATPTPWGERLPTLSSSRTTAGIRGTDLGVAFDHQGRRFLLFGDTHWTRPWLALRDSIAEVIDDELPRVRFHGSPLRLRGHGATMGEYDVPLDAFSHGGTLFALFSSNHGRHRQVMGRSVLARLHSPELVIDPAARHQPVTFDVVATLSEHHFINVSVQRRPAAEVPGCPPGGDVLLLWGTGSYRASEVRLAMLDAEALDRLAGGVAAGDGLGSLRYWDGQGWSAHEEAAVALFTPGAYGELSVRWVPQAGRYAMLLATGPGDAAGPAITLWWAEQPWGPWTTPLQLLDWVAVGMSVDPFTRFIKAGPDDPVAESIFPAQARGTGAAYAPYLYDARLDGDELVVRYTLSTWNPYQVVLMEHRLVPGEF